MNTKSVILARTTGAIFTLLGLVHSAATPFVLREPGLSSPDGETAQTFTVMFLATGFAVLWSGSAVLLAAPALGRGEAWSRRVLALVAAFVAVVALLCVATMPSNPFARVTLAAAYLAVWTPLSARAVRSYAAAPSPPPEVLP